MLEILLALIGGYIIIRLGLLSDRVVEIIERLCRSDLNEGDKTAETDSDGS